MSAINVYAAGGEDSELYQLTGGTISTTANTFRASPIVYARCSLATVNATAGLTFWQYNVPFSQTVFWCGARLRNTSGAAANHVAWRAVDVNGLPRLRIRCSVGATSTWVLEKVDGAGTLTTLATFVWLPLGATPEKFDVFVNYAVAGEFSFYFNRAFVASFVGDVTTNGLTVLANVGYGAISNTSGGFFWSETIVCDLDTRSFNLNGFDPVANGNTHNFDVGTPAAANVNQITTPYTTIDGATTAGLIDQYTVGAVAAGTYGVLAVGVSVVWQVGTSGPSKGDVGVRTGGTDYWSADQSLITSFTNYLNWWATNPNTGVDWTTAQIGAAAGFNIGVKSVT